MMGYAQSCYECKFRYNQTSGQQNPGTVCCVNLQKHNLLFVCAKNNEWQIGCKSTQALLFEIAG